MAVVNSSGQLVKFTIRPGNVHEASEFTPLVHGLSAHEVIADKAYDSRSIRVYLDTNNIIPTIPSRSIVKDPWPYDLDSYKTRHVVENYFAHLKQFRGIATRYCKLADRFRAFVCLAAWALETRRPGLVVE